MSKPFSVGDYLLVKYAGEAGVLRCVASVDAEGNATLAPALIVSDHPEIVPVATVLMPTGYNRDIVDSFQ